MDANEELKLLHDGWTAFWSTYITWFTWHFAIHVTVLTAFIAGSAQFPKLQNLLEPALILVTILAGLGFAATIAMRFYEREIFERAEEIEHGINHAVLGGSLVRYATVATICTNGLLFAFWIYLLCHWPFITLP
jgi:hypothetical protein